MFAFYYYLDNEPPSGPSLSTASQPPNERNSSQPFHFDGGDPPTGDPLTGDPLTDPNFKLGIRTAPPQRESSHPFSAGDSATPDFGNTLQANNPEEIGNRKEKKDEKQKVAGAISEKTKERTAPKRQREVFEDNGSVHRENGTNEEQGKTEDIIEDATHPAPDASGDQALQMSPLGNASTPAPKKKRPTAKASTAPAAGDRQTNAPTQGENSPRNEANQQGNGTNKAQTVVEDSKEANNNKREAKDADGGKTEKGQTPKHQHDLPVAHSCRLPNVFTLCHPPMTRGSKSSLPTSSNPMNPPGLSPDDSEDNAASADGASHQSSGRDDHGVSQEEANANPLGASPVPGVVDGPDGGLDDILALQIEGEDNREGDPAPSAPVDYYSRLFLVALAVAAWGFFGDPPALYTDGFYNPEGDPAPAGDHSPFFLIAIVLATWFLGALAV